MPQKISGEVSIILYCINIFYIPKFLSKNTKKRLYFNFIFFIILKSLSLNMVIKQKLIGIAIKKIRKSDAKFEKV